MTITIPALHVGFWIIPFLITVAWVIFVIVENCKSRRPTGVWDLGLDTFFSGAFQMMLLIPVLISWIIWLVFK